MADVKEKPIDELRHATVDRYYSVLYDNYALEIYAAIRRDTHGEDFGQTSWITAEEQDKFIFWLEVGPGSRVLDVGCGSGGPTARLAERAGCTVVGVDIHERGVVNAKHRAERLGLSDVAEFQQLDAGQQYSFPNASFDALICIDALNHFPNRARVFGEWYRLLRPGGRLLFTDPATITGYLSNEEIATRSAFGYYLFVPGHVNGVLLAEAGLRVLRSEDVTENMASTAQRWFEARAQREDALRRIEGDETYEGQQQFFRVAARIAKEKRLSRYVFLAEKPG